MACFWRPDPCPSTSSPLDEDDESEDVDVDLGDEGAAAEVVTWGSAVAKADWMSRASLSLLSGSMALYSRASGAFSAGAAIVIGRAAIGCKVATTGLPLPLSSSDSPSTAKERRRKEVEKLRALRATRARTTFLPLLFLKHSCGAARASGCGRRLLSGNLGFGGALRGLDLKERENQVAPRATKLRLQQIILGPRYGTKDFVGAGLHLCAINFYRPKTEVIRPSKKNSCSF